MVGSARMQFRQLERVGWLQLVRRIRIDRYRVVLAIGLLGFAFLDEESAAEPIAIKLMQRVGIDAQQPREGIQDDGTQNVIEWNPEPIDLTYRQRLFNAKGFLQPFRCVSPTVQDLGLPLQYEFRFRTLGDGRSPICELHQDQPQCERYHRSGEYQQGVTGKPLA